MAIYIGKDSDKPRDFLAPENRAAYCEHVKGINRQHAEGQTNEFLLNLYFDLRKPAYFEDPNESWRLEYVLDIREIVAERIGETETAALENKVYDERLTAKHPNG